MSLRVCVLASGSSGNATLVSDGQTHVLVDCGLVAKEIERRLGQLSLHPAELSGVLITHAHLDHFRSAGTIFGRYRVPVYIERSADRAIRQRAYNGSYDRVRDVRPIPQSIGGISIDTFPTRHSVWGGHPMGFVLSAGGARIGLITDTGEAPGDAVRLLRGCQVLVAETNYESEIMTAKLKDESFSRDWHYLRWVASEEGHLSNQQCAKLLAETVTGETRHVFLAHISENHLDRRRDNNSFARAERAVRDFFRREGLRLPALHRTYRRDATEGQASVVVTVD